MKRFLIISSLIFAMCAVQLSATAQTKIGYTNIELVLAYMPESKSMEQQLKTFQTKLAQQLTVKDQYAQSKLQEYQKKVENGTLSPEGRAAAEKELMKMDEENKLLAQKSERDLQAKREELIAPVLTKLQKAIDDVANENGYTHILNQTTSAGVSTILFGPDKHDVTQLLMKKLNIAVPANK
jgi:outer membrane protein